MCNFINLRLNVVNQCLPICVLFLAYKLQTLHIENFEMLFKLSLAEFPLYCCIPYDILLIRSAFMHYINIICLFFIFGCATEKNKIQQIKQSVMNAPNIQSSETSVFGDHIGEIEPSSLLKRYPAFDKQYQRFTATPNDIEQLKSISQPLDIIVVFGTWCHDSKREVSRFIKLVEATNNPFITTKYWAVDRNKKDPQNYAQSFKLEKTPTFIIQRSGHELGRIVERPKISLTTDIISLL
jgi:thiol-disulfide isomerase/thioredoxin